MVSKIVSQTIKEKALVVSNSLSRFTMVSGEEKKLSWIFIFILLCGASKGFMKALKAFIKPFEAPQGSVKIKT